MKGEGSVTTEHADGTVTEESYTIDLMDGPLREPDSYQGPWAEVEFGLQISVQMGDRYTLSKPYARVTIPAHPAKINLAWDFAVNWVDEKLLAVRQGLEAGIGGNDG